MLRSLTRSIINVVKCHNPNSIRIEQKSSVRHFRGKYDIIYTPLKIISFLLGG